MIFSSLACLFSLCTQVLFTWIKDGKINNNTMQTGTCKIPTEGMTVPRPVAPALPPILFLSAIAYHFCLTQPILSPVCQKAPPASIHLSQEWQNKIQVSRAGQAAGDGKKEVHRHCKLLLPCAWHGCCTCSCAPLRTRQPPSDFQPCTNTSLSSFLERCDHLSVFPTNRLPRQRRRMCSLHSLR